MNIDELVERVNSRLAGTNWPARVKLSGSLLSLVGEDGEELDSWTLKLAIPLVRLYPFQMIKFGGVLMEMRADLVTALVTSPEW